MNIGKYIHFGIMALLCICFSFINFSFICATGKKRIRVNNAYDISKAMQSAKPGDTLVMQNGIWKDQKIIFEGNGTENNPIVLMA
ncbi:MAG: hypothetical protein EPN39_05140, partial [Chitinophagaceae bacterium]